MNDFLKQLNYTLSELKIKLNYKGTQVDSYVIICPNNIDKRSILKHCSDTFPDFQPTEVYQTSDITQNMYKGQHVVMPFTLFNFIIFSKIKNKTFTFIDL